MIVSPLAFLQTLVQQNLRPDVNEEAAGKAPGPFGTSSVKQGADLQIRMILYDLFSPDIQTPSKRAPLYLHEHTPCLVVGWCLAELTLQPCPGAQAAFNNERFASL